MSRAPSLFFHRQDRWLEHGLARLFGKLDVRRRILARSVLYLNAMCVALMGLLSAPNAATTVVLVSAIFFLVGSCLSGTSRRKTRDMVRDGLRFARYNGVILIFICLAAAAITAVFGPLLTFSAKNSLAEAACYAFLSIALYTLPLMPREEGALRAEADQADSPRAEYEKVTGELADLDRRQQELLGRKAKLEAHPDINRT